MFTMPALVGRAERLDGWGADGWFNFQGEGQQSDQQFIRRNLAILEASTRGRTLRLFEYQERELVYRGAFVLGAWDRSNAPAIGGGATRSVIVFGLRPVDSSAARTGQSVGEEGLSSCPQPDLLAIRTHFITVGEELTSRLRLRPELVHSLSWRGYEQVVAELLRDQGWDVELTPCTRDGGRDILAYLETGVGRILCLVEAKKYRPDRPVGVEVVRALYGTLCDHDASAAMVVATSYFTADAYELQRRHQYRLSLKDYGVLEGWIRRYRGQ